MKQRYFLGFLAGAAACAAFAGCNLAGGSLIGGGSGPTPTPPIPSADYYVNGGIGPQNEVYAYSTSSIAAGGSVLALSGQPYKTADNGQNGAPFGMAMAGGFLYVVNNNAGTITSFPVSAADGTLGVPLTSVSTAGNSPSGICVDPTDKFLVVANTGSNTIESFTIASGVLTAASSGSQSLTGPAACTFSTDSTTVYVTNNASPGGVAAFSISGTGILSPVGPTNVFGTGHNLQGIVANGGVGGGVFAADQAGNELEIFTIASGGSLAAPAIFGTALGPIGLALSPNGKYLYVAASAPGAVDAYAINNSISLTRLPGAPYQIQTHGLAYLSVNPAGTVLVALSIADFAATPFSITSTGTLGFPPQSEYVFGSTGQNPRAIIAR